MCALRPGLRLSGLCELKWLPAAPGGRGGLPALLFPPPQMGSSLCCSSVAPGACVWVSSACPAWSTQGRRLLWQALPLELLC